jgi:hypothetical protein
MRRHAGQALVITLAFTAMLAVSLLLVFNAGQLVNAKQRLVNAADAAAYSAAVWQARSLNYQAYLNRAVIANEAAIAQSVSLRSWSGYMNVSLRNMNTVLQFVPYVGAVTRALSRVWAQVDASLQPSLEVVEGAMSQLNHGFAAAAESMHTAASAGIVPVVRDVAARNQRDTELTRGGAVLIANNVREYRALTRRYVDSERGRQADLILRSRDRFSANRPWDPLPQGNNVPLRFLKRGGTDLIGFDQWRGMDTFAMHRRRYIFFGGWRESVQIGWGGAENGRAASWRRGEHGGSWRTNPRTSSRAANATRRNNGYRGIPGLRDVVVRRRADEERQLRLAVELGRDSRSVALAGNVLRGAVAASSGGRRAGLQTEPGSDVLRAAAEARVFFDSPQGRRDGRHELGSLFSPYWRARLAPVSSATRLTAAAANGVVDPFAGVRP